MKVVQISGDEEVMEVVFEDVEGHRFRSALASEAAVWLLDNGLLDAFGADVVGPGRSDAHDPTYNDRLETFMTRHHAPTDVVTACRF